MVLNLAVHKHSRRCVLAALLAVSLGPMAKAADTAGDPEPAAAFSPPAAAARSGEPVVVDVPASRAIVILPVTRLELGKEPPDREPHPRRRGRARDRENGVVSSPAAPATPLKAAQNDVFSETPQAAPIHAEAGKPHSRRDVERATEAGGYLFGPEEDQSEGSDADAPDDFEKAQLADQTNKKPYVIDSVPPADLTLVPPTLPDLTKFTSEALYAKIVTTPAGNAVVGGMLGQTTFKGFTGGDERLREWAIRQSSSPKVIFISGGYITPKEMARRLPPSVFAETSPGVFVARLPIDVRPGSSLHIDKSVKELRLSQDRGAFLIVEGKLFVTGTTVLAWNERENRPAWFQDKHEFRPFITSWGGSETYITDSKIGHLGYAASKSYGVSITQFSPAIAPVLNRPPPHGWILNSEFYDLWYGFYCYEADDVVVRGNTYRDNIKYGIDPHDRSKRLIIAENKTYGTKEKHGIIVSREVNDSWIIGNESYENNLSGIVIDRNSVNNLIAYNKVYRNKADGITIYESPKTLIWRNLVTANARHGIRVRNSTDLRLYENVALGNGLAGVYGHIKDLSDTDRNLRLDPFAERVSMVIVGGQLVSNGSGPVSIDQPLSLEMYNVDLRAPQRELGIKMNGVLGHYQEEVLNIMVRQRKAVVIKPALLVGEVR